MNFQADVTVTMSVVTTAASPVIPTQQTIHPMTPIVELRLLRILTLLNTKMQTLLFLTLQMLRKYLHLIVVGAVVTILVRDVMQKPPQFVRQTNSEPWRHDWEEKPVIMVMQLEWFNTRSIRMPIVHISNLMSLLVRTTMSHLIPQVTNRSRAGRSEMRQIECVDCLFRGDHRWNDDSAI